MSYRNMRYSPLPLDKADEGDEYFPAQYSEKSSKWNIVARVSLILIAICAFIDAVALTTYITNRVPAVTPTSVDSYPLRSPYIQLDYLYGKLGHKSSKLNPVVNIPDAVYLTNASDPHATIAQPSVLWGTTWGNILTATRRMMVTPKISTILHFHAMDFGMENCELTWDLPPSLQHGNGFETMEFDAWTLDDHREHIDTITYASKPKRDRYLGTLRIVAGEQLASLPAFPCTSGSFYLVEIACRGTCHVDFEVPRRKAEGFHIRQHQTV